MLQCARNCLMCIGHVINSVRCALRKLAKLRLANGGVGIRLGGLAFCLEGVPPAKKRACVRGARRVLCVDRGPDRARPEQEKSQNSEAGVLRLSRV